MNRLNPEARMTIKTLAARGATNSHIARLLGVTEGAVRHHVARLQTGALDGRSRQEPKAACVAAAIDHWRQMQDEGPINLAVLHGWLVSEHGYSGSLRSIQRYWARSYPAPAVRARRRVETPPGAQAQVDWAHFPTVVVGGIARDLVALHMVLSWSRKAAIVWSETKDMLAWLGCQTACFTRLGGVPATVRVDNEKTAMARGAGAWGTVNLTYRRYATVLHFHVDACPPRQPRAKGKVERRVRDQRFALDPRQQAWRDLADLQQWTDARLDALLDLDTGFGKVVVGQQLTPTDAVVSITRDGSGRRDQAALASRMLGGRAMRAALNSGPMRPVAGVRRVMCRPSLVIATSWSRSRSRSTSPHSGRKPALQQRSSSSLRRMSARKEQNTWPRMAASDEW